ncbi:MAG: DUF4261 domain-containing protein [Chloroflexota bacterium]|nr:DUF4261 domain-containing protein [Chloroflexota bacterium]
MTVQTNLPITHTPTIYMVFSSVDLTTPDENTIAERIASTEDSSPLNVVDVRWEQRNPQKCLGMVQFRDHKVQFTGLSMPLPPVVMDQTVHVSRWQPQIKAAMRQHLSHLSLQYTGKNPDPVEKMIAMYQTAHAFDHENLLGVINPNAWTAHPPADFLNADMIRTYHQNIPFSLWIGYVKFFIDKQHFWLLSRGHHIFDVPDLAYLVQADEKLDEIINHFINVFYYIYEQDVVVTAGDTLAIQGTNATMQFSEVEEGADFLMGPSGTLVIEKIRGDEG